MAERSRLLIGPNGVSATRALPPSFAVLFPASPAAAAATAPVAAAGRASFLPPLIGGRPLVLHLLCVEPALSEDLCAFALAVGDPLCELWGSGHPACGDRAIGDDPEVLVVWPARVASHCQLDLYESPRDLFQTATAGGVQLIDHDGLPKNFTSISVLMRLCGGIPHAGQS